MLLRNYNINPDLRIWVQSLDGNASHMNNKTLLFFRTSPVKTKIFMVCLLLLAIGVVGSTSWVIHRLLTLNGYLVTDEESSRPQKPSAPPVVPEFSQKYEIEHMSVELPSSVRLQGAHAEFSLVFDCPSEESKRALLLNRARLRDNIFDVAAGFTVEKFQSAGGFQEFKSKILKKLKEFLAENSPRAVAIKDWVMN